MRWYSFLTGYLIIIIEGEFPEKVINMCLVRGIFLWDISQVGDKKILLKVRLYAFRPLARIVKKCKCRLKIIDREGLPFWLTRLRKRKILALGSIFFLISLYILSSFVWFIEIKGNEDLTTGEIREIAAQFGLKPGVVIKQINFDKLGEDLQEAHPKLAWVGISVQGTKVTIEIAEKVLIPETEDHTKAHLVAKEAGLIEEMLVLVGTTQVKEGDQVKKGQLLISGIVYPELYLNDDGTYTPGGNPELVRAKGIVRARVIHSVRASCPLKEWEIFNTGKRAEQVLLKIGGKTFVLKGTKHAPFQHYQKSSVSKKIPSWRNIQVPVEFITNIYIEQIRQSKEHSYESAYAEAIFRAEKALARTIPNDAKIINKLSKVNPIETDNIVEVEVIWECLENIAIPEPILETN